MPELESLEAVAGDRRYHLMERIGKGGFGAVYRAKMTTASGLEKQVAVKVLHANVPDQAAFAARMRDEARVLALLRHRAIVAVDDLMTIGEQVAVVMELIEGADLSSLLRLGPVPPRAALEIARDVSWALAAAHEATDPATGMSLQIIHRDIKPANIRVTPTGDVKVMDFGVARARFKERESMTDSLSFGSWGYMAPERFDDQETTASDIYAVGAVLYEALTGERLKQLSVDPEKHRRALTQALSAARVESPGLLVLMERMMAYQAVDRPSATEAAGVLRALAPTLPGLWLNEWCAVAMPELSRQAPEVVLRASTTSGHHVRPAETTPVPGTPPATPRPRDPLLDVPEPRQIPRAPPSQPAEPNPTLIPRQIRALAESEEEEEVPSPTPLPVPPVAPPRPSLAVEAEPEPEPGAEPEAPPPPRRGVGLIIGAALGGLAAVLLAVLLVPGAPDPVLGTPTVSSPAPTAPAPTPPPAPEAETAPVAAPVAPVSAPTSAPSAPLPSPAAHAEPAPEAAPTAAPSPTPEAAPEAASTAPEVASAEPEPAAAQVAPAAQARATPSPEAASAASLSGSYSGEAFGRPMSMSLKFSQGGAVAGTVSLRLGAQEVVHAVSGSCALNADGSGTLTLTETDGDRPTTYQGSVSGKKLAGSVLVGGRSRGSWSAQAAP